MNKNEIDKLKALIGTVRGAEITVSASGGSPKCKVTVVTAVSTAGIELSTILLDAPAGDCNKFDAYKGVENVAIDPTMFDADGGIRIKLAEAPARFKSGATGQWGESPVDAVMASRKVSILHRIAVEDLSQATRIARRKAEDGSWQDVESTEGTASFPCDEGRITAPYTRKYLRLLDGKQLKLLPPPVTVVPTRKAGTTVMALS